MSDKINIEIIKTDYDKINSIKKWYNISNKTNKKKKQILSIIIKSYIENNSIEYLEQEEVDESDIKAHDSALRSYQLGNNLSESGKEKALKIQSFLQSQDMKKKKVTINDAIEATMDKYVEIYPQIEQADIKTKFIKQKILLENIKRDYRESHSPYLVD